MNAVISGQLGVAFMINGDTCSSIHFGRLTEIVPRRRYDFLVLFDSANDLQYFQKVSIEKVKNELDFEASLNRSLMLLLSVLDVDYPKSLRIKISRRLNNLLEKELICEHLGRLLYALPMSPQVDFDGAIATTKKKGKLMPLLLQIRQSQQSIRLVYDSWLAIPDSLFASGSIPPRKQIRFEFARRGLNRSIVKKTMLGGTYDTSNIAVDSEETKQIVGKWLELLRDVNLIRDPPTLQPVKKVNEVVIPKRKRPKETRQRSLSIFYGHECTPSIFWNALNVHAKMMLPAFQGRVVDQSSFKSLLSQLEISTLPPTTADYSKVKRSNLYEHFSLIGVESKLPSPVAFRLVFSRNIELLGQWLYKRVTEASKSRVEWDDAIRIVLKCNRDFSMRVALDLAEIFGDAEAATRQRTLNYTLAVWPAQLVSMPFTIGISKKYFNKSYEITFGGPKEFQLLQMIVALSGDVNQPQAWRNFPLNVRSYSNAFPSIGNYSKIPSKVLVNVSKRAEIHDNFLEQKVLVAGSNPVSPTLFSGFSQLRCETRKS